MKRLKVKTTSKKTNFEAFEELSYTKLILIKGGTDETPPDKNGDDETNG